MLAKTTSLLLAGAIAMLGIMPAAAQTQGTATSTTAPAVLPDVDALETRTMEIALSGAPNIGTRILGGSAMMAGRTSELAVLDGQIASTLPIYGRAITWERAGDRRIGTLLVSRRYLVQHEKMLTVWYVSYIRLQRGWEVVGINFNDQVQRLENDW
jgi:hypothetical protein